MLIVKKYGGSSVATPEKILNIAKNLKAEKQKGYDVIVVVSAMGDTTDDLINLARAITKTPIQRELDMLLSSGERISMALMAMALNSIGVEAISFTGSQSGVFTDSSHNNAQILEIKPMRIEQELKKGKVVIVAGFQGVDPKTKEVTTLGRGGSDTTAVALAAHFKAERCDILTDVNGLYSADPRIPGITPEHFKAVDYETALEMAFWGARVLHHRCVALAQRSRVPINVSLSTDESTTTLIREKVVSGVKAINFNCQILSLFFPELNDPEDLKLKFRTALEQNSVAMPEVLQVEKGQSGLTIYVSLPSENFEGLEKAISNWFIEKGNKAPKYSRDFSAVTITGRDYVNSSTGADGQRILKSAGIDTAAIIEMKISVAFIVPTGLVTAAIQTLHSDWISKS